MIPSTARRRYSLRKPVFGAEASEEVEVVLKQAGKQKVLLDRLARLLAEAVSEVWILDDLHDALCGLLHRGHEESIVPVGNLAPDAAEF